MQSQSLELQNDHNEKLGEVQISLSRCEQVLAEVGSDKSPRLVQFGDYELIAQLFRQLSTAEEFRTKLQRFMDSLQFEALSRRREAIPEAHKQTLRWLLHGRTTGNKTSHIPAKEDNGDQIDFSQWLVSGNGIFWVSGKPGSGKSTLMKFVAGAVKTYQLVSRWASPTIIVAHYFWSSGSSMQKSQEGLLRSLLYSIFQQCPELIPTLCRERWREFDDLKSFNGRWSLPSLMKALRKITKEETKKRVNFCFFIDGMDEFEGSHDDQFELVRLTSSVSYYVLTLKVLKVLMLHFSNSANLCINWPNLGISRFAYQAGRGTYLKSLLAEGEDIHA